MPRARLQSVTLIDATAGAPSCCTTNGRKTTINATKYIGAITVSSTETLNAVAAATGYGSSAITLAKYTVDLHCEYGEDCNR